MAAPLLLATKHLVPAPPREHVDRPGLLGALDEPRRVLLLPAPPGYGRTTLLNDDNVHCALIVRLDID